MFVFELPSRQTKIQASRQIALLELDNIGPN
jgi:hypothetical protein